MTRGSKAAFLGLLAGVIGLLLSALPVGLYLEENIGLEVLFHLRGVRKPPSDVVVVDIDRKTADVLDLSPDIEKWPRSLHATLVRDLADAGASVIVFDVYFQEPRSKNEDEAFSEALRKAGNVVLCQALAKESVSISVPPARQAGNLMLERLLSPFPLLAQSAAALAPFPLPKVPVKVSQYWTFGTAEARPTLPTVAFQVFTLDLYQVFLDLLAKERPASVAGLPRSREDVIRAGSVGMLVDRLRETFTGDPRIAQELLGALERPGGSAGSISQTATLRLKSLIRLYRSDSSRYINFYGPAGTITTVPYYRVLRSDAKSVGSEAPTDLRGKAVFVGVAGDWRVKRADDFFTVFSQENGAHISGVEIAATAFANILEDMPIRPLSAPLHLSIVLLWGVLLGIICCLCPASVSALCVFGSGMVYLSLALQQFGHAGRWWPLVVPLGIQGPVALLGAVLWKYVDAVRDRRNIRKAFGLYLPDNVVDQLTNDLSSIKAYSQIIYGTCLCTDGERFTSLSERLHPKELSDFLNRYYEMAFRPVKNHGGSVSDVLGDSMMAIWTGGKEDVTQRMRACQAALEIDTAVIQFNAASGSLNMPTRMGLHSGEMSLGNIGGMDRYEYRPVGDAINTASRIENVNKHLGTRILASREVVSGLDCFLTREVGTFLLAGKSKPIVLHELICRLDHADERRKHLCAFFTAGLRAYRRKDWNKAINWFQQAIALFGEDGPAVFYLDLCERYKVVPPQGEWDAWIRLDKK